MFAQIFRNELVHAMVKDAMVMIVFDYLCFLYAFLFVHHFFKNITNNKWIKRPEEAV